MVHDFTHGVMFHHFHDGLKHKQSQGSISAEDFAEMLDWLGTRYNILSAPDYQARAKAGTLSGNDICITFDDALLCQYEIAVPELKRRNLPAFFFIYSGPYNGEPDYLEIFRTFRHEAFGDVDGFYESFFANAQARDEGRFSEATRGFANDPDYLRAYPFYTDNDRWFRYLRDEIYSPTEYREIVLEMMKSKNFDPDATAGGLWMKEEHVRALADDGHVIGLHSYSHPTVMSALPPDAQAQEYERNRRHLEGVCGQPIRCMSHPCNSYSSETLSILEEMGIELGFCATVQFPIAPSHLEIPREDHANVMRQMSQVSA